MSKKDQPLSSSQSHLPEGEHIPREGSSDPMPLLLGTGKSLDTLGGMWQVTLSFIPWRQKKMRPSDYSVTLPKEPVYHILEASNKLAAMPMVCFCNPALLFPPSCSSSTPTASTVPQYPKLLLIPSTTILQGGCQVLCVSQRLSPVCPKPLRAC